MRVVEVARDSVLEPCSLDLFEFQIDPYVGCEHHCLYCYVQNNVGLDWESEVGVIPGLEEKAEAELAGLPKQTIYMGMNTDPYQPVEADLKQTRLVLQALAGEGLAVCILTKSDLVVRDIELITSMEGASVGFSFAFTDEETRAAFEEHTMPLEARLEALAAIRQAGVETYALVNPVIPGVTPVESLIDLLAPRVDTVWVYPLNMGSREAPNWRATHGVLARHFPEALEEVERSAFDSEDEFWRGLRENLMKRAENLPARLEIRL
jgi:DNA repair photolyase